MNVCVQVYSVNMKCEWSVSVVWYMACESMVCACDKVFCVWSVENVCCVKVGCVCIYVVYVSVYVCSVSMV